MTKNNYNELESQIGDIGAESALTGKKLKHAASYGGKEELDASDQASLDGFLNRSKKSEEEVKIGDGWIPLNREEMGIRSIFYPEPWEFYIKPATVSAIKNWTGIDEERPDQVHKIMNEICKSCIKIDTHMIDGAGWTQINSWDRFWFILKVREYTFSKGESKV